MHFKNILLATAVFTVVSPVQANVIGTNIPARPLTAERAAKLPTWKSCQTSSERWPSRNSPSQPTFAIG
jgi:hypothetical protein